MRGSIATLLMAVSFMTATAAAGDLMSAYYGNTWEYQDSEGVKLLRLDASGAFHMVHFNGNTYQGRWSIEEREVCFHVGQDVSCFGDIAGRALGERWTGMHDGETYAGRLYAGQQAPRTESR